MARTAKIAKSINVPTGPFARPPFRRAPAKPAGLYLLELRARAQQPSARRRLHIAIDARDNQNTQPEPVKITLV